VLAKHGFPVAHGSREETRPLRQAQGERLFDDSVRSQPALMFDPGFLMVHYSRASGRMRYRPDTPWERHDD
jgi:hypothetical protein